ncbi:MAG: tetratricopeptide repeat protein [Armatimonadetes bacterium]|nr:tetratricopeptide repeat protein [Armatimonadota bacterium]
MRAAVRASQRVTAARTFMFTDIEGSTRLWENRPEEMKVALARHDGLLRAAIECARGRVFKATGDGFCAVFNRPVHAVAAALSIQKVVLSEAWDLPDRLKVRVALHAGEAEDRSGDFFGLTLNRCARLLSAAHGGQVLLSSTVEEPARANLPSGATLKDLGEHRLRDLSRPMRIFQLVHADLQTDFPLTLGLSAVPNNLPVQLTSFIGRDAEMAEVKRLLGSTRLLTLSGAGGCGKTRLALQAAADVMDLFPDGVWLVDLVGLSDPSLVPQAVLAAIGGELRAQRPPLETAAETLGEKTVLLLVDNCEHLVEGCALTAESLLQKCRNLKLLVTSRESLGAAGETVYVVPGMPVPEKDAAEGLMSYESVHLFVERARDAKPAFRLNKRNSGRVSEICRRVDGIPLAIELAAARIGVLTPRQIAERLKDRFKVLKATGRTAVPRHQTLEATLDWSHELLSEEEKALLRRLAVFSGGWTLEQAEDICQDSAISPEGVLDLLSHLVAKSLVIVEEGLSERSRYRMLETVRQYADGKLSDSEELEEFRARHCSWFQEFAKDAEPNLSGPHQGEWFERIEADLDNVRAALTWTVSANDRLAMATSLWLFWYVRGLVAEGRGWLDGALSHRVEVTDDVLGKALTGAGVLATAQGEYDTAETHLSESLRIMNDLNDQVGRARVLQNLGVVAARRSDFETARRRHQESLAIYRELGDEVRAARVICNLGAILNDSRDYESARPVLEEGLELQRKLGDRVAESAVQYNLGTAVFNCGEHELAVSLFRGSLMTAAELKDAQGVALNLSWLARVECSLGKPVLAARLLGAAGRAARDLDSPLSEHDSQSMGRIESEVKEVLGEPRFDEALAAGRDMPVVELIAACAN